MGSMTDSVSLLAEKMLLLKAELQRVGSGESFIIDRYSSPFFLASSRKISLYSCELSDFLSISSNLSSWYCASPSFFPSQQSRISASTSMQLIAVARSLLSRLCVFTSILKSSVGQRSREARAVRSCWYPSFYSCARQFSNNSCSLNRCASCRSANTSYRSPRPVMSSLSTRSSDSTSRNLTIGQQSRISLRGTSTVNPQKHLSTFAKLASGKSCLISRVSVGCEKVRLKYPDSNRRNAFCSLNTRFPNMIFTSPRLSSGNNDCSFYRALGRRIRTRSSLIKYYNLSLLKPNNFSPSPSFPPICAHTALLSKLFGIGKAFMIGEYHGMHNKLMQEQELQSFYQDDPNRLVYPSLNVYFSPRVYQQKIDHKSVPMCVYTRPVQATDMVKARDQDCPDSGDLRQLTMKDGLMYQLKQMNKRDENGVKSRTPLKIKVLACVCMYNENKNAIQLTLSGIYDNLKNLEAEGISCEEVAVVLMQDGILKLVSDRNKRTYVGNKKEKNSMVEFYRRLDELDGKPRCDLQERINTILDEIDNHARKGMSSYVANNRDFPTSIEKSISLLYQNLWHPGMTDPARAGENFDGKYLKIFSCFKHLNGTKLSSHLWFFQGFCRYLDPEYIVLLDVGTKPEDTGVVNLLRGFIDKDVGGCTGLMSVDSQFPSLEGGDEDADDDENCCSKWMKESFFSIQKAQQYQYIIAHFLDKNAEGALGFLHVLPGAWSAYRYKALIKSEEYEPNLLEHSYFKMILNPQMEEKDYREANMYLAEDRILSLGIYCQTKEQYYLRYVPDAIAKTDPMKDHENLMKQRRRWINSSLFAFLYVFRNYYFNAMESRHSFMDKYVKLNLSMILALLSFATSYLTPSLYFYVLFATIYQISPDSLWCRIAAQVVSIIYIMVYLVAVAGGLTGAVWTKHAHVVSAVLSFFTFAMWGLVTYNIVFIYLGFGTTGIDWGSFNQVSILVMTGINLGIYYFVVFMHMPTHCGFVWRLFKDQISYLTYQGAYAQTMVAHAFCNVDDVSWGTKGSTASHGGGKKYETEKVFFVSTWLFYNCLLAYIMIYIDVVIPESGTGPDNNRKWMLIIIAIYGTTQMLIKSMLAIYYHFKWCFTDCRCLRKTLYPDRLEKVQKFWSIINQEYREAIKDSTF